MKYPGDTSLSEEIRERILKTFEQALDLADSGSHREALLGCDFVLRLDPLFEPARVLHRRLSEGGDVEVADLRGPSDEGTPEDASDGGGEETLSEEASESVPDETATPSAADGSATIADPAPPEMAHSETAEAEAADGESVEDLGLSEAPALADAPIADERPPSGVGDSGLESLDLDEVHTEPEIGDRPTDDSRLDSAPPESAPMVYEPMPPSPLGGAEDLEPEDDGVSTGIFDAESVGSGEPPVEETSTWTAGPLLVEEPSTGAAADGSETSPSLDPELVRSFVDEPLGSDTLAGDMGLGDDLTGSGESIDQMAPPLGAPTELDEESQQRIAALLAEGQSAFDIGEYQSAIDSWSRVFLIDIDHAEANERIEQARRMAAEAERQIEEVFHEAISHLDAGDTAKAREALRRALELQPGHLAAQELLDRIDSGEAVSGAAPVESTAQAPTDFELDETYEAEEGSEDLFAAPDIVPAAADLEPPPPPEVPDTKKKPRQTFLIVGSIVLVLVIGGGWYLMNSWDSLFPNSDIAQGEPAPQRIDPIARANKLHEQGKTSIAIAQLRRLPPGDPHYAEAQALVAQWETAESGVEPEGPSPEEMARYDALVRRARQAHGQREYLLVDGLLDRAAAIAPLEPETQALQAEADRALEPLEEQIQVFRSGDWEYALPTLWRMRETDASNPNITRLIVDSYYNLGVRDLQRGNPGSALDKFEEALNLRPGDPTLTRLRAFAATYENRSEDLLYRIFVKYLPFR